MTFLPLWPDNGNLYYCAYIMEINTEPNSKRISNISGDIAASVLETVEKFMDTVKDSLANGENVYLRGFGSFIVKTRSQKTARNISKNTVIIIPEHKIPAFKPAKVFMDQVK